jgi:hypothetical protein
MAELSIMTSNDPHHPILDRPTVLGLLLYGLAGLVLLIVLAWVVAFFLLPQRG